jgi:hypothetical protein
MFPTKTVYEGENDGLFTVGSLAAVFGSSGQKESNFRGLGGEFCSLAHPA